MAVTVKSTSQYYFGTLSDRGNGPQRGYGPTIVEIRVNEYLEHSPSYYVYFDGVHQCGGAAHFYMSNNIIDFDAIAASLPWSLSPMSIAKGWWNK